MCFKLQKCEIWPFRPSKIETRTEFSVEEKKESTIFQLGFHRSTYKKRKKENEEEENIFQIGFSSQSLQFQNVTDPMLAR